MLRTLLILSFVSYAVGCTPGTISDERVTSGAPPRYDPSLAVQTIVLNEKDCKALPKEHNRNFMFTADSDPFGCHYYDVDGSYRGMWYNYDVSSTVECSEINQCVTKCYTNGCNDTRATNYDEHAYEANGCAAPAAPSGVVKTCDNPGMWMLGVYNFCYMDYDAKDIEYYVIEKAADYDCAFLPVNGELDFSTIDTGELPLYIGDRAFDGCIGLTSVILPESARIGYQGFANTGITSLTLPSGSSPAHSAFSDNQLTSLTISDGVTSIGDYAFSMNQLTSLTIPSSVTSIGSNAFYKNQLTSLTFPSSVTSIGASAFRDNQLTSVTIPDSVTSIGNGAFAGNPDLQLTLPAGSAMVLGNWGTMSCAPGGIDETDCGALKTAASSACAQSTDRVCVQQVVYN